MMKRKLLSRAVLVAILLALPAAADAPRNPPQYAQFDSDSDHITDNFTGLDWDRRAIVRNSASSISSQHRSARTNTSATNARSSSITALQSKGSSGSGSAVSASRIVALPTRSIRSSSVDGRRDIGSGASAGSIGSATAERWRGVEVRGRVGRNGSITGASRGGVTAMMRVPVWVVLQHDPVVVLRVGPDPGVRLTNSVL